MKNHLDINSRLSLWQGDCESWKAVRSTRGRGDQPGRPPTGAGHSAGDAFCVNELLIWYLRPRLVLRHWKTFEMWENLTKIFPAKPVLPTYFTCDTSSQSGLPRSSFYLHSRVRQSADTAVGRKQLCWKQPWEFHCCVGHFRPLHLSFVRSTPWAGAGAGGGSPISLSGDRACAFIPSISLK